MQIQCQGCESILLTWFGYGLLQFSTKCLMTFILLWNILPCGQEWFEYKKRYQLNATLTFRHSSWLALEPERGSETCSVIETPAFLYFGWAAPLCRYLSHRRTSVIQWCLPALNALTTRTGHANTFLKAQFLTTWGKEVSWGREGKKEGTWIMMKRRKKKAKDLLNIA